MSSERTETTPTSSSKSDITIDQLFYTKRKRDAKTSTFSLIYWPVGVVLFILRSFIGFHAFLVACILRKTTAIRSIVLRFMCAVLGVVVKQKGERDESARILCANHVSILDHLAIDLLSPCLLPSVWDIPTLVRWCFGYVDLGASMGREQLVRSARKLIPNERLPLLAFPEGIITSGQKALLKFNTWSFDISDTVQPIAMSIYRPEPLNISPSIINSSWWSDVYYFFFLPFTVINVEYLPKMERIEGEAVEEFSARVAAVIANKLGIIVSKFETREAEESIKLYFRNQEHSRNANRSKAIRLKDPRQMDECAMRIKQSYPTFHLSNIRNDLEKTKNQAATVNNLKNGKLPTHRDSGNGKITLDASSWKKIFDDRKWDMIETNRSKYLQKDS